MKDWRTLRKDEIIHLTEAIMSDATIEHNIRNTRSNQKRMQEARREVCWECKSIAIKLGIES